ncbi:hypothetical protein VHEMI03844 [[Torrubiella] hemipterigena]|uniref:Crh-like protein n=1 Tax=[Torrubiella] hemipterigena TaxID=1531966 RepID=A0A0A1TEK6_9HYPO|nr:hypothetical protein VHEMI03844 [[Torrubiella] hemipterigena]
MFSKTLNVAVAALAASSMVSAQTFTSCDPTKKSCPADPAFGKNSVNCDFTKGKCSAFHDLDGTSTKYNDKGAVFSIEKVSNAPTAATKNYIFFGRVDIEIQAAAGNGIVTSAVLQSDDLDEIDWEWVGGDSSHVQSNYFSKGDTTTYDRGGTHPVSNALTSFHTYSVEWTKDAVNWIIDGTTVRTLTAAAAGAKFPQTPMQVKIGTWCAGGPDSPPGTRDWAGGLTDFSKAPFNAYYKSIKIVDYAGGSSVASNDVKSYSYGDKTGSWGSIKVEGGKNDDSSSSSSKDSSSTSAPKSTGASKTGMQTSNSAAATNTDGASTTGSKPTTSPTKVPDNAAGRNSAALALIVGSIAALFL